MRLLFVLRTDSYEQVFGEGLDPVPTGRSSQVPVAELCLFRSPNSCPQVRTSSIVLHVPCMARADTERAIAVPDRLKMVRGVTIAYCRYAIDSNL
jgi:hypothetical protein